MVMRASLARKESRRQPLPFRRADFPEQDDKNWLAFSAVRLENGKPTVFGIPIKASFMRAAPGNLRGMRIIVHRALRCCDS